MLQKPKCGNDNITTIRTSSESHIQWKEHFHGKPLHFRIYSDFEADEEIDNSNTGKKTTNIYKQSPVLDGYEIVSELDDVLQSGYYKSILGYDNVDWFVNDVIKIKNKLVFFLKDNKKYIIMTQENKEYYRTNIICRFCEKEYISDKVRDHCDLAGKNRGPAHSKYNINVTQKQSNSIALKFHVFSNYNCLLFFKKLVDKMNDKVKFDIIPKTNEEYITVTIWMYKVH